VDLPSQIAGGGLPAITVGASTVWKTAGSAAMGLAGMLFLGYGRKAGDLNKIAIGAALTFASILLF
jgi:hypothetical protein